MILLAIVIYVTMAAVGALGMLALGHDRPWISPLGVAAGPGPMAAESATLGVAASVVGGLVIAGLVVVSTRAMTARWTWARALRDDLADAARALPSNIIVGTALLSGVAEELFFRGMLVPLVGIVPAAVAFGLVHQMRGRSRWTWAAFAAAMGLVLGALFLATGSVAGPVVAHVIVNVANLRWLRRQAAPGAAPVHRLGGIFATVDRHSARAPTS